MVHATISITVIDDIVLGKLVELISFPDLFMQAVEPPASIDI